jgi:galactokinase
MDQFISTLGQLGHLLLIDCRANAGTPVPLASADVVVLVTNSNVKHALSGSEYPTRVKQCQAATDAIAASGHVHVLQLRDATSAMLEAAKGAMDAETHRRALHVVGENARVLAAVKALEAGDFGTVGRLMLASHASLRDNFEVSTPELDTLVDLASSFEGVYGSRMTGGGFGGCTVTLVRADRAEALAEHLTEGYKASTGKDADCFVTRPGAGAGPLALL